MKNAIPDKNFKSYESLTGESVDVPNLSPSDHGWSRWDDTMKTFECYNCDFNILAIDGGEEDCIDLGTHTTLCSFRNGLLMGGGSRYLFTIKSHSEDNTFEDFHVMEHAKWCDIQLGNWSDQDNRSNGGNRFYDWTTADCKPVTYSYRLFSGSRPEFVGMQARHLWWLSVGMTIYFWVKWLVRKIFY